jgi:hypothetical protein
MRLGILIEKEQKMTTEYQPLREPLACERLLADIAEVLSEAACTIVREALNTAYSANLAHNHCFQPEEYEEAMEKLQLAAPQLTGRDCELLAKVWRAALAAAAYFDPKDRTPIFRGVDRRDLHWYYRMLSSMVEVILQEKEMAEHKKESTEREQIRRRKSK